MSPADLIEKMSMEERKFFLPYLPNNAKKIVKSPVGQIQKNPSRENLLYQTTELNIDTPVKSY